MKFAPHATGKAQQVTYATVKDAITSYIQKTYDHGHDMAKALEDNQEFDFTPSRPTRAISFQTGEDKRIEQEGFDIDYREELRIWNSRKETYRKNKTKAYSLILTSYCSTAMQKRVEQHPDFKTKIKDDPIALLEVIKTLMHATVRAQYPWGSLFTAISNIVNIKQHEMKTSSTTPSDSSSFLTS